MGDVRAEGKEGGRAGLVGVGVKVGAVNLISQRRLQFASPFNYYFFITDTN